MSNKWFAAMLGFLMPPLALLYLAKLRIAALYLVLFVFSWVADYYLISVIGFSFVGLLLGVLAAIHGFILAKTVDFKEKRKWYSHWWGALSIPISIFVLIFLTRSFVVEPYLIPSDAMSPSLEAGDYVLVKKWGYGLYGSYGIRLFSQDIENRIPINRGEMVVFIPPHDSRPFVKRVVGVSGDVVEFRDKQLIINGNLIDTTKSNNVVVSEIFGDNVANVKYINDNNPFRSGVWAVPDNHYFVMGDNRDNSADSRVWGMVPAENIIGRILIKW
ncbi:signal peptidase I [Pseudomonas sp. HK3]